MKPARPVLRYHGGKWRLAPWVIAHFPEHRVYVEPFGGGASVLMRKQRSYAEVYNERDGEVVNVFRVLQNPRLAEKLRKLLRVTPFARDEFYKAYKPAKDRVERARRTIIRSLMGFGSDGVSGEYRTGFRANAQRSGTTPAHAWGNYPYHILHFTDRLQGVVVENRDAIEVVRQHDSPKTLFYVDPPYLHETRGNDKRYRHEMTDEDHRRLAACLHSVKGMVVLSGYPSPLYGKLYGGWRTVTRKSLADGARPRTECLWLNFNGEAAA